MAGASDRFSVANRVRAAHRLIQVTLGLLFFAQLNYLAMHHYTRFDVTESHLYSLSPETRAYLRSLDEPVRLIVTIPEDPAQPDEALLSRYVRGLLNQYLYVLQSAGKPGILTVEYVDVFKDIERARELSSRYGLEQNNVVLVTSDTRNRLLVPTDIFEFEGMEPSAFKGEQAFTSAILEVTTADRPVIYFTIGHGEMRLDDVDPARGLSELAAQLRAKSYALGHLDLSQTGGVPNDADLVVVTDPRGPFLPEEQEKLRRYALDRAGRIAIFLSPGQAHGLDRLLGDWGIRADDMVVFETGPNFLGAAGSFLIREFTRHPVTEPLERNSVFLVSGLLRPVRPDMGAPIDDRLSITPILLTSPSSWADAGYRNPETPRFDPAIDLPGGVTIGALAERRSASQLGIDIVGGRLLAVGTGDLFANRRLGNALGNQLFLSSSINWLLERDQTLALPARPIEKFQFNISQGELQQLALLYLLVPTAFGIIGLVVMWMRKL